MLSYRNLLHALEAAPAGRPFVTQWIDEDEQHTVTFGEFREQARGHACALRDAGVARRDRVVVIMPQSTAAMTTFVGAMMIGAVPAFLAYPNFKVEASKYRAGLAGVSSNLSARAVVIDEEFPEDMLQHVSLADGTNLLRVRERLCAAGSTGESPVSTQLNSLDTIDIDSSELAFIQHSAGTTGLQKGVALTHAAVLRQIEHLAESLKIDVDTDRVYSWLPLYHDMGLIACFMLPMVYHLPLAMQSPLDWVMHPDTMLQIIDEHKCTLAWMPNFAFQFVPRRTPRDRWTGHHVSSLRALINCSEPVRRRSMSEFQSAFGVRSGVLQSSYAMAENVFAVTQSDVNSAGPADILADGRLFRAEHRIVAVVDGTAQAVSFTSSGRVLTNAEAKIVSDDGDVVGENFVGEILVKSDCMFDGYFNRPDFTANVIIDGWYHTGDLGFLSAGELYVVGRKKDLLIVGGENIYPQDIEEIVGGHPAIHDGRAVAIGLYNSDLGTEEIVVVAEVESDEYLAQVPVIEREIRSRIVAGMGVAVRTIYLEPQQWIVKSTAGKAARSATREKLLREHPELSGDV